MKLKRRKKEVSGGERERKSERGGGEYKVIYVVHTHTHTWLSAVEYAQIDWHSFVIVETINFRESEAGMNKHLSHSSP